MRFMSDTSDAGQQTQAIAVVLPHQEQALVRAALPAQAAGAGRGRQLTCVKQIHRKQCGNGRWGSLQERKLISSLMHQGKMRKRAYFVNQQQRNITLDFVDKARLRGKASRKLAKVLPKHWRGGRRSQSLALSLKTLETKTGGRWLTAKDILDIGFGQDSHRRSSVLAAIHGISETHARSMKLYSADCFLFTELHCLGWLCKICTEDPPDYALSRLAWDETAERLTLCLPAAQGNPEQQRSTWQVMVIRARIIVGWISREGRSGTVIDWTLVVPPVIVRSPSSAQIYYGLFHSPLTRPIMMARFLILQRAKVSLDLSETDDAGANTRLEMHLLHKATTLQAQGARDTFKAHFVCRLHQQQLIEVLVVAVAGMWVLSRLYSFSLLLRSHGMFLRLLRAFREVTREAVARAGPQPADAAAYLREFKAYVKSNHNRFRKCEENIKHKHHWVQDVAYASDSESDGEAQDKGKEPFMKHVDEFFDSWNGRWWLPIIESFSTCGQAELRPRMLSIAEKVVFRAIVGAIACNKWTKLGPVLDWILLGYFPHRVLGRSLEELGLDDDEKPPPLVDNDDPNVDDNLKADLSYSAVRGKRYKASVGLFKDSVRMLTLLFVAISIEALRFLSCWWMRRARETDRYPQRVPFLDMMYAPTSPLVVARQYLASLLWSDGGEDRLQLVWRYQQFESYKAWCEGAPGQARELRRLILVTDASLYRRHSVMLRSMHWRLTMLADQRVDDCEKDEITMEFDSTNACCLPPGFARQLKVACVTGHQLRYDPLWQEFLLQLARLILQQVCDLEWRHGRNRTRADRDGKTRLDTLTAEAVLAEAKLLHEARGVLRQRERSLAPAPAPSQLPTVTPKKRARSTMVDGNTEKAQKVFLRAQTAEELHRWDWMREQKEMGIAWSAAAQDTWDSWRVAFANLPANRLASYQSRSQMSVVTAKSNRATRQREQQAAARREQTPGCAATHAIVPCARPATQGWPQAIVSISSYTGGNNITLADFCKATGLPGDGRYPLGESQIANHGPYKRVCRAFTSRCAFSKWYTDDSFPDRVTYPARCGCVCSVASSRATKDMYDAIVDACGRCVDPFGVGRALSCADLVLAFEVFAPSVGQLAAVLFFDLREAHGSSGIVKSGQTLLRLKPVPNVLVPSLDYKGLVLQYALVEHVFPARKPRAPFDRARCGQLNAFTEGQLARFICDLLPPCQGEAVVPAKVTIRRLQYRDIDLKEIVTHGVCEDFQPIELEAGNLKKHEKRGGKSGSSNSSVAPGDLLGMLNRKANAVRFLKPTGGHPAAAAGSSAPPAADCGGDQAAPVSQQGFLELLGCAMSELQLSAAESGHIFGGVLADGDADDLHAVVAAYKKESEDVNDEQHLQEERDEACAEEIVAAGSGNPWAELGLRETTKWHFSELEGAAEVGLFHQVGPRSLKATCRKHKSCVCWLSKVTDLAVAERDLAEWLSKGGSVSRGEHDDLSRAIKIRYGMRVRQK